MDIEFLKLSDITDMDVPLAVQEEVHRIQRYIHPKAALDRTARAFAFTVDLYEGRQRGYQACNTGYHDLKHATDTALTMARLLHGAAINEPSFPAALVDTCLIAALLHDAGYIQSEDDLEGTGAKYTLEHVPRSADLLVRHADALALTDAEADKARLMILCTDLATVIEDIAIADPIAGMLGRLLMAADLLSQLSDRKYLEKLLFLYEEFREAGFGDYKSGRDLLIRTLDFYDYIEMRLGNVLLLSDVCLTAHFKAAWHVPVNLYERAIRNQKNYLESVIHRHDYAHERFLKRGDIAQRHIRQTCGAV